MTLAWMVYLTVVSGLAAAAGLAFERVARLYGRPLRWAWAGSLGVSLGLPALAWAWPRLGPGGAAAGGGGLSLPTLIVSGTGRLDAIASAAAVPGRVPGLDGVLLAFWGFSIALAGALVARSAFGLRRERRHWSRSTVEGERVWLSADRGPAVVGFRTGAVVVPRWLAGLDADVRRAVLLHEREHLRARDHRLHVLAGAAVLLAPWNPFLWWQLRRLRLAIECDCDARVLARGVPAAAYGRCLLEVGARLSRAGWGLAAFAEPKSLLERRVEIMTRKKSRLRAPKAAVAAIIAAGTLGLSCEAVPPTEPGATISEAEAVRAPAGEELEGAADRPTFIPYDSPPRLQNAPEVQAALKEFYPDELEQSGVGGTVGLWMYVDERGEVGRAVVKESSGHEVLDEAARSVADRMAFEPAMNRDQPTPVWVMQNITFEPSESASSVLSGYRAAPPEERPLIVIDGVIQPLEVRILDQLNALDIRKVEILKGASARGLYGERGRNGVVVITRKEAVSSDTERR